MSVPAMLRRVLRGRDGSATVEFVLVLPIVALFMLGIIELGRMFWHRSTLEHAVEETGRYAMAHVDASQDELTGILQARAGAALPAGTITITYARATTGGIRYLTITATCSFTFMTGVIPTGPVTLQSRARVPLLG